MNKIFIIIFLSCIVIAVAVVIFFKFFGQQPTTTLKPTIKFNPTTTLKPTTMEQTPSTTMEQTPTTMEQTPTTTMEQTPTTTMEPIPTTTMEPSTTPTPTPFLVLYNNGIGQQKDYLLGGEYNNEYILLFDDNGKQLSKIYQPNEIVKFRFKNPITEQDDFVDLRIIYSRDNVFKATLELNIQQLPPPKDILFLYYDGKGQDYSLEGGYQKKDVVLVDDNGKKLSKIYKQNEIVKFRFINPITEQDDFVDLRIIYQRSNVFKATLDLNIPQLPPAKDILVLENEGIIYNGKEYIIYAKYNEKNIPLIHNKFNTDKYKINEILTFNFENPITQQNDFVDLRINSIGDENYSKFSATLNLEIPPLLSSSEALTLDNNGISNYDYILYGKYKLEKGEKTVQLYDDANPLTYDTKLYVYTPFRFYKPNEIVKFKFTNPITGRDDFINLRIIYSRNLVFKATKNLEIPKLPPIKEVLTLKNNGIGTVSLQYQYPLVSLTGNYNGTDIVLTDGNFINQYEQNQIVKFTFINPISEQLDNVELRIIYMKYNDRIFKASLDFNIPQIPPAKDIIILSNDGNGTNYTLEGTYQGKNVVLQDYINTNKTYDNNQIVKFKFENPITEQDDYIDLRIIESSYTRAPYTYKITSMNFQATKQLELPQFQKELLFIDEKTIGKNYSLTGTYKGQNINLFDELRNGKGLIPTNGKILSEDEKKLVFYETNQIVTFRFYNPERKENDFIDLRIIYSNLDWTYDMVFKATKQLEAPTITPIQLNENVLQLNTVGSYIMIGGNYNFNGNRYYIDLVDYLYFINSNREQRGNYRNYVSGQIVKFRFINPITYQTEYVNLIITPTGNDNFTAQITTNPVSIPTTPPPTTPPPTTPPPTTTPTPGLILIKTFSGIYNGKNYSVSGKYNGINVTLYDDLRYCLTKATNVVTYADKKCNSTKDDYLITTDWSGKKLSLEQHKIKNYKPNEIVKFIFKNPVTQQNEYINLRIIDSFYQDFEVKFNATLDLNPSDPSLIKYDTYYDEDVYENGKIIYTVSKWWKINPPTPTTENYQNLWRESIGIL